MGVKIRVENYRVLRKIERDLPKGVCALVGPNGSGKTTLLDVLDSAQGDPDQWNLEGINDRGGLEGLRNIHAGDGEKVELGVELDNLRWTIQLTVGSPPTPLVYEEFVHQDGDLMIQRSLNKPGTIVRDGKDINVGENSALKVLAQEQYVAKSPGWSSIYIQPLDALVGYRLYPPYHLDLIRNYGSDIFLQIMFCARTGQIYFPFFGHGATGARRDIDMSSSSRGSGTHSPMSSRI